MSRIFVDDIVIDEASGNAIFTVYLDVADPNTITVSYNTRLGAAKQTDLTPKANQLTFLPGETSITVSIPIKNDLIFEASEGFLLQLSNPSTNATLANDDLAYAIIIDDDAQPGVPVVSINDFVVDETKNEAIFFITLDKPSNSVVSMSYNTQNGTAFAGSDFTAINGTLSFAPGEMVKTVKVSLLNDNLPENPEAFNLVLSAITNATMPDPVGTAIIAGNDAPRVTVSNILVDDIIIDESQAFADFLVRLDAPNINTVTVRYQTSGGTAGAGDIFDPFSLQSL